MPLLSTVSPANARAELPANGDTLVGNNGGPGSRIVSPTAAMEQTRARRAIDPRARPPSALSKATTTTASQPTTTSARVARLVDSTTPATDRGAATQPAERHGRRPVSA